VDGEIAGYVKHAKGTKLTFLLVLGGSHMCPMDKPKQTYDMINRFLMGKGFNDEETMIDLPFTPTVPYIPGDVVNVTRRNPSDPYHTERRHSPPSTDVEGTVPQVNFAASLPETENSSYLFSLSFLFFSAVVTMLGVYAWHVRSKRTRYEQIPN